MNFLTSLIAPLAEIGQKLIVDKDKQLEYAFKLQDRVLSIFEKMAAVQTIPWVDAVVKLMGAVLIFGRPLGSLFLTVWGIKLHLEGAALPDWLHAMMDSAFPAWAAAREVDKSHKRKIESNN